ncbi:MAG: hypothetical protein AUG82_06610 [Ktedonobacter sp. 13_1_20CM_4_53_11]|nr:MAG: hypothetical protein AUG82_06610 [Ktedonobacter sp. 13_1_20CM_4_53_11]
MLAQHDPLPTPGWRSSFEKRLPMGKHRSSSFVCDNESKFGPWFARVATTGAIEILKTPSRAPQGNAICERFMRHIGFDPVHDDS